MRVLVCLHYLSSPRASGGVTRVSSSLSASSEIVLHGVQAQRGSRMAASPQAPSPTQAASRLKEQEAQRLIQLRGASLLALTHPFPIHIQFICPVPPQLLHHMLRCFNLRRALLHSPQLVTKARLHAHAWGSEMAPDPSTYSSPACCHKHVQYLCLPVSLAEVMAYIAVKLSSVIQSIILCLDTCPPPKGQVRTTLSSFLHQILFWQSALQQEHADSAARGRATFAAQLPQRCHANHCGCRVSGRPGLLLLDISHDVENRRIPVFNTVDDDQPPTGLQYIRYCHATCTMCQHCAAAKLHQPCFLTCHWT